RTISFAEVYQNGNAQYKHMIVEHPLYSGDFYILKCDEHGVHFKQNPLAGAAKHLHSSQHGHISKEYATALKFLGYRVVDCDAQLAINNNSVAKKAFAEGYEPLNLNKRSKPVPISLISYADSPRSGNFVSGFSVSLPPWKLPKGIAPGELYLCYWAREKRHYAILTLPWGDLSCAGMQGTLSDTGLLAKAPKCYSLNGKPLQITGWAEGYEDDGPLVSERVYAVMYFDQKQ
ncbi:hypothetical protein QBC46DRAFT_274718, partial [Diplogelasinospora grovesii]